MSDIEKLVAEAREYGDAIVGGENENWMRLVNLVWEMADAIESERTRADKAETSLTNLEAGFKSFMRSHNQLLDENERLREVIKQVRAWNEHTDFIGLETIIAAAVPVEPQGDYEGGQ